MEKIKKGRTPINYSAAVVLEAVKNSYGIVSRVSERLECDWNTAKKYIEMYPESKELFDSEIERVLDLAESKVIKSINMDDIGTAKWLLSNKGKHRGYTIKTELEGTLEIKRAEYKLPDGTIIEM